MIMASIGPRLAIPGHDHPNIPGGGRFRGLLGMSQASSVVTTTSLTTFGFPAGLSKGLQACASQVSDELERAQPVSRVVHHGGEHQLIGGGRLEQAGPDRALTGLRHADDLGGLPVGDERLLDLGDPVRGRVLGVRAPRRDGAEAGRRNDGRGAGARRRVQPFVGLRADDRGRDHCVRAAPVPPTGGSARGTGPGPGRVLTALKWWAKANGRPSRPATWAL